MRRLTRGLSQADRAPERRYRVLQKTSRSDAATLYLMRLSSAPSLLQLSGNTSAFSGFHRIPRFEDHHTMLARFCMLLCLLTSLAHADLIGDVHLATSHNNFAQGDAALLAYRTQKGITPEYLEALSWMARGALAAHQLDQADSYAHMTV